MPRDYTGADVDTFSEQWRHHCEVMAVIRLDGYWISDDRGRQLRTSARRHRAEYLARVESKRGAQARAELEAGVTAAWAKGYR